VDERKNPCQYWFPSFQGTGLGDKLDAIWENILPALKSEALPDDSESGKKLAVAVENLTAHPAK